MDIKDGDTMILKKGRRHNKFKREIEESRSCLRA
jgi:hypothetical protein